MTSKCPNDGKWLVAGRCGKCGYILKIGETLPVNASDDLIAAATAAAAKNKTTQPTTTTSSTGSKIVSKPAVVESPVSTTPLKSNGASVVEEQLKCHSCSATIKVGSRFCTGFVFYTFVFVNFINLFFQSCGASAIQPTKVAVVAKDKICSKCSFSNQLAARFCGG